MLADAGRPRDGTIASLLVLGALLFAAIGVVVQAERCVEHRLGSRRNAGPWRWHFIRSYVVSLAAVLALGLLLLVSLMVTTGLAAFSKYAAPHIAEWLLHRRQPGFTGGHRPAIRDDVQMASGRHDRLRRLARCRFDGNPV
jgi:membrane protein